MLSAVLLVVWLCKISRLDCVCGAIRDCQFDWIDDMSHPREVLVESGADVEAWMAFCDDV